MSKDCSRYFVDLGDPDFSQVSDDQFVRYLHDHDPWYTDTEFPDEFTEIIFFYNSSGYMIAYSIYLGQFNFEYPDSNIEWLEVKL